MEESMFRHLVPCLALIGACAVDAAPEVTSDQPLFAEVQAGPPGAYGIDATPMVVGRPFTLRITGVTPGQRAFIFRAPRIQTAGFCPPPIAPDCLDLPAAQAFNQFNGLANASGQVVLSVTLPSVLGLTTVAWQGVSPTSGGGANTSPALLLPVHQLNSDLDGDNLTAQQEVDLFGTDPGAADSDGGSVDDDVEIANGTDPNDPGDDVPVVVTLTVDDLVAGDLIITEIMKDPSAVSDTNGEWFEVYNNSGAEVELQGLVVSDEGSDTFTVNTSVLVPVDGHAIFVLNGDSTLNGGIAPGPNVYDYGSFSLGNSDDEVVLSNSFGVIDVVRYDNGPSFPDPAATTINLNPDYLDANDNDIAINWCTAVTPYGSGDLGTPGTANDPCPDVTWTARVSPLLQSRCAGCHVGGITSGGANFDNYATMFNPSTANGMPLIAPGNPANSYLLHKLNGTQLSVPGGNGSIMPLGGAMPQYLIDVVTRWVEQGAQN
jgi:hypothetical protein